MSTSGYKEILKKMAEVSRTMKGLDNKVGVVGFFGSKGAKEDPETGLTNAQKAYRNNFGSGTTPARPFFTTAIDENVQQRMRELAMAAGHALQKTSIQVFNTEGKEVVKQFAENVKKEIIEWSIPSNAPMTIEKKGFNDPLVDTGSMRDSVDGKIINRTSAKMKEFE